MPRKPSLPISTMMAEYFLHPHDKLLDSEPHFFDKRFADDLDNPCNLKKPRFDLDLLSAEHETIKIINSPIRTLNTLSKSQGRKKIMTKFYRERTNSTEQENDDPTKTKSDINGILRNSHDNVMNGSVNGNSLVSDYIMQNTEKEKEVQDKAEEKKQIFICNDIPKDDFDLENISKEPCNKDASPQQVFVQHEVPKPPVILENNIPKQNGHVEVIDKEAPKQAFLPVIPTVPTIPISSVNNDKNSIIPTIPSFALINQDKQPCPNGDFNREDVPKRDITDVCGEDLPAKLLISEASHLNHSGKVDNVKSLIERNEVSADEENKKDDFKENDRNENNIMDHKIMNGDLKAIVTCNNIINNNNPLTMHMKFQNPPLPINNNNNNGQEEPETCPHCFKTFRRKGNFQKHLEREHGQIPLDRDMSGTIFKCPHCPYSTKHQSNLHVHKRVHTGERPYCCGAPYCGAKFTQGGSLKSHIKTQHDANMEFYKIERSKEGKTDLAVPSLGWNPSNPLLPLDAFLPGRPGHNGFLLSGSMMLGELAPPCDQVLDLSCDSKKMAAFEELKKQKEKGLEESKIISKDSSKELLLPIMPSLSSVSSQSGPPLLNPATSLFSMPVSGASPNPLSIPLSPLPPKSASSLLSNMAPLPISSTAPLLLSTMPPVMASTAPTVNMMMKMSMPPALELLELPRHHPLPSQQPPLPPPPPPPPAQQQQQSQKPKHSPVNSLNGGIGAGMNVGLNGGLNGLHFLNQIKIRPSCIPGCPNFEKLRNLRRNVVQLLTVLVPDLDLSRADLDCDSDNVDNLLHEVISTNAPMNYR